MLNIINKEGAISLLRGIQPVLYGYYIGAFVYYYSYAHSKIHIRKMLNNEETEAIDGKKILYTTLLVSFVAAALSELLSLTFYYPFDLIKTRMQINDQHRYNGVLDAIIKIF